MVNLDNIYNTAALSGLGRLKKGSREAKVRMAYLRSLRGRRKKTYGGKATLDDVRDGFLGPVGWIRMGIRKSRLRKIRKLQEELGLPIDEEGGASISDYRPALPPVKFNLNEKGFIMPWNGKIYDNKRIASQWQWDPIWGFLNLYKRKKNPSINPLSPVLDR